MVSEKVVLIVSNSSSEIAECLTVEFLKLGHKVAKACGTGGVELEGECRSNSANQSMPLDNYLEQRVDFENEGQVDRIISTVLTKFGRLDVLINNLSHEYQPFSLLGADSFDEFNKALQVDLYAPARLAQLSAPYLRSSSEGGVIINIAPGTGQSLSQHIFRDIIKAGLVMLTKTLSNSFENENVRCLGIVTSPDRINSQAGAANYLTTKISELVKFLISGDSNYVNATIIETNSI